MTWFIHAEQCLCLPCCACCTSCSHPAQTLFLGHSPGTRPGCGAAAVRWGDQNPLSHLPQHPWGRECSLFHGRSLTVSVGSQVPWKIHLSVPRTGTSQSPPFHSRSLSVTWSTDPLVSPHVPGSPLSVPRTGTPSVAPHPSASPGEAGSPQLWGPEGRVPSGSPQRPLSSGGSRGQGTLSGPRSRPQPVAATRGGGPGFVTDGPRAEERRRGGGGSPRGPFTAPLRPSPPRSGSVGAVRVLLYRG